MIQIPIQDQPELPPEFLEQLMGPDPNVIMLDQIARNLIMFSLEAAVYAFFFIVAYVVARKLSE